MPETGNNPQKDTPLGAPASEAEGSNVLNTSTGVKRAPLFTGLSIRSFDDKDRIYLPAKWKRHFSNDTGVVFTREVDEHTGLGFLRAAILPPTRELLEEAIKKGAIEVPFKRGLRIHVNTALKVHADLGHEAVVCGCFDYFELWSPERYAVWRQFAETGKLPLKPAPKDP